MNDYITGTELVTGLEGLKLVVSVGAVCAAYLFVWRRSRLDLYRDDLFRVRDDLWDQMAACGTLHHPGHRLLRRRLNALIAIAPTTNILVLAMAKRAGRELPEPESADLPPLTEAARAIQSAESKMIRRLLRHVLFGSIPAAVLTAVGIPFLLLTIAIRQAHRKLSERRRVRPWTTLRLMARRAAEDVSNEAAVFESNSRSRAEAVCV